MALPVPATEEQLERVGRSGRVLEKRVRAMVLLLVWVGSLWPLVAQQNSWVRDSALHSPRMLLLQIDLRDHIVDLRERGLQPLA